MNLSPLKAPTWALAAALIGLSSCQTAGHDVDAQSHDARSHDAESHDGDSHDRESTTIPSRLDLGAFSISLSVKDLAASRAFYEALGFEQIGGVPEQNWIILRNGHSIVGLFQGMFEGNMLTFNPGWAASQNHPEDFTDIRDLEKHVIASGIVPVTPITDEARKGAGPASLVLVDPDGNPVLIDQHR